MLNFLVNLLDSYINWYETNQGPEGFWQVVIFSLVIIGVPGLVAVAVYRYQIRTGQTISKGYQWAGTLAFVTLFLFTFLIQQVPIDLVYFILVIFTLIFHFVLPSVARNKMEGNIHYGLENWDYQLIAESLSPDGTWLLKFYTMKYLPFKDWFKENKVEREGSLSGKLVDTKTGISKVIYHHYYESAVTVHWLDNQKVDINGRVLNVFEDKWNYFYHYKKEPHPWKYDKYLKYVPFAIIGLALLVLYLLPREEDTMAKLYYRNLIQGNYVQAYEPLLLWEFDPEIPAKINRQQGLEIYIRKAAVLIQQHYRIIQVQRVKKYTYNDTVVMDYTGVAEIKGIKRSFKEQVVFIVTEDENEELSYYVTIKNSTDPMVRYRDGQMKYW